MEPAAAARDRVDAAPAVGYTVIHQLSTVSEEKAEPGCARKERLSRLELEFAVGDGGTLLRCLRRDPPWAVMRGFALKDGESLVHLNNVSGGIFGGDRLELRVKLHADAEAQLTTTGATRVYRPRADSAEAVLDASFEVGRGATLEYLPDALIPFAEARVYQHQRYALEEGATLLYWDVVAPGRLAMGECFAYRQLKLASEIRVGARPVLNDRMMLEPQRWPVQTAARMGPYKYLVTMVAMRAGSSAAEVRLLEERIETVVYAEDFVQGGEKTAWGVTRLPAHGVMVRGLVQAAVHIPADLHRVWSAARWQLLGRDAVMPRKTY